MDELPPHQVKLCPLCKRGHLQDRVPRAQWVKTFFFFLPLKRFKCYACYKRPYIWDR